MAPNEKAQRAHDELPRDLDLRHARLTRRLRAQVKGHVAANLNVGNDRASLIDVLNQLIPFIGYPRALNGLRIVDEVTKT